jgi:hypothetical protein
MINCLRKYDMGETEKVTRSLTPKFLSLEFHTRFFPALLWQRLGSKGQGRTGFGPPTEFPIVFVICIVLIVIGLPMAIDDGSFIGWVIAGLGGAGMLFLIINSIASRGNPPDYDAFLPGIFFFFVTLGLTAGIFTGFLEHSASLGMALGGAGLVAGYLLGILGGLYLQYLGWMAVLVNGLAWMAVIGMLGLDLVLLGGGLS